MVADLRGIIEWANYDNAAFSDHKDVCYDEESLHTCRDLCTR